MESMVLIGAEDVRAGGSSMRIAAAEMQSAANMISSELERHRIFLDDWLYRLEQALNHQQGNSPD